MYGTHPLSSTAMGQIDFKTLWNQSIRPALTAGAQTLATTAIERTVQLPEVQAQAIEASKSGIKASLSRGVDWVYTHPARTALYVGIPMALTLGFIGYKVIK